MWVLLSHFSIESIIAGTALGGAIGTAMAGAWRTRALVLWREQAQALDAQNHLLREKVEDLERVVARMDGELQDLRALPNYEVMLVTLQGSADAAKVRQTEILVALDRLEAKLDRAI